MSEGAHHSIELEELERRHADLCARVEKATATDAAAVLELGAAVLVHRALRVARSVRILSWLDPAVSARIGEEQDRLGQDLELLLELVRSAPASADAASLAGALLERLRELLRHDERALQRPLMRLLALGELGAERRDAQPAPGGSQPRKGG